MWKKILPLLDFFYPPKMHSVPSPCLNGSVESVGLLANTPGFTSWVHLGHCGSFSYDSESGTRWKVCEVEAEQWLPCQKKKKSPARGWWLVKNYVVLGPLAPWIDLLKPQWLVYAKQSTGAREGPRQTQARTSPLMSTHTPPTRRGGGHWIQISLPSLLSPSCSLHPPPPSQFPRFLFSSISAMQR